MADSLNRFTLEKPSISQLLAVISKVMDSLNLFLKGRLVFSRFNIKPSNFSRLRLEKGLISRLLSMRNRN